MIDTALAHAGHGLPAPHLHPGDLIAPLLLAAAWYAICTLARRIGKR